MQLILKLIITIVLSLIWTVNFSCVLSIKMLTLELIASEKLILLFSSSRLVHCKSYPEMIPKIMAAMKITFRNA